MRNFFYNKKINLIIKNHIEKKLLEINKFKYVYAVMSKSNPENFITISNENEWFRIYHKNKFQFHDPVLITALDRFTPFLWDENIMLNAGEKIPKILTLAKNHNITNGYTSVLHDQYNNLAVLSIMLDKNTKENIDNLFIENDRKPQEILIATHEKLINLYRENKIIEKPSKTKARRILSKRENEIIYWASVGKSYQEISIILGIKTTTVKFHMGNIVNKLGVSNAKHAIRVGVEKNIIRQLIYEDERENHIPQHIQRREF